jgi:hypothetical protein
MTVYLTLFFNHVLEGQWLLVEPFARGHVWTDEHVGEVQYWPLALDTLAEYPILSSQEAWDLLCLDQPGGRVWHYPYRSSELAGLCGRT